MRTKSNVLIALMMLAAVLAFGGIDALAQTDGHIYACVVNDGTLRIVSDANQCKRNETLLSWNITGPAGPQGPKGDPGSANAYVGLIQPDGSIWQGSGFTSTLAWDGTYMISFPAGTIPDCTKQALLPVVQPFDMNAPPGKIWYLQCDPATGAAGFGVQFPSNTAFMFHAILTSPSADVTQMQGKNDGTGTGYIHP